MPPARRVESRRLAAEGERGSQKVDSNAEAENSGTSGVPGRSSAASGGMTQEAARRTTASAANAAASSSSTIAPATATPVAISSTALGAASAGSDINEFLARARAMGLNLTRQDYERARAGVSAFLRAERISSGPSTPAAVGGAVTAATSAPPSKAMTAPAAAAVAAAPAATSNQAVADPSCGDLGDAIVSEKARRLTSNNTITRTASGTTLSFFTAVLPTKDANTTSKPRLDDVSSLQERRRRREKRRRIREKAEREANDADCESGSHRCTKAVSEPIEESPMTDDTPHMSIDCSPGRNRRTTRYKSSSLNLEALARVGLGISGSPPSCAQSHTTDASQTQSPHTLLEGISRSPALSKLTRKAHVNADGHLVLLPSPVKGAEEQDCLAAVELITQSAERVQRREEEAEMVAANAGGETDDSGVSFAGDAVAAKKDGNPMGCPPPFHAPHHRRISSFGSSNDFDDGVDALSFLERVMAQKRSPLRLRKEAKARERQARLAAANNDLIVMTAMATTSNSNAPQMPKNTAPMPPPSVQPVHQHQHMQQQLPQGPPPSQNVHQEQPQLPNQHVFGAVGDQKSVRWAADFSSPRKRMTTKEIYDFEFYGIAPHFPQHQNPALMAAWENNGDADAARRTGDDDNLHQRQRSHFGSTSFGSPVATRSGHAIMPESPGMLSMVLNDASLHSTALGTQLLAKRGLLFGGGHGGNSGASTPNAAMFDGMLGDVTNIFSQGPTLARSPARKGLIETETPPRLARANTLATPISLAHSAFNRESNVSVGVTPERTTLVRARSTSDLERHSRLHGRPLPLSDTTKRRENKENEAPQSSAAPSRKPAAPAGWANRSSNGGVYDSTISPAAIFGMQQAQQQQRQQQQQPQPKPSGRRPAQTRQRIRKPSAGSGSEHDRQLMQHSASEVEGDDERDPSPLAKVIKARSDAALAKHNKTHARSSSMSTNASAYDDSPLMLDTRNNKATVVVRPASGDSLARAVDMPGRSTAADGSTAAAQEQTISTSGENVSAWPPSQHVGQSQQIMEWDKPDMSRVVKLVSEELQAALDSGTLTADPAPRFYKLPSDWGKSTDKPTNASYAGMIGQAILSSSDGRLSLNEIYNWISSVFPYFERGDRGWQNSIRHNLSLNKSFIKVERDASIPGKGGWWAIKEGHEERFRAGNYYAPGTAKAGKEGQIKTPKIGSTAELSAAPKEADESSETKVARKSASRKRVVAERSEASDDASDSDALQPTPPQPPATTQTKAARKRTKKAKVGKGGRDAGKSSSEAIDGAQMQDTPSAVPHALVRLGEGGMTSSQGSMLSPSPKHFDTITPSRPYAPGRMIGTSSSDFGSAYASSIMHNMPVLTDASSPPSSPNNPMPPPAGGVRGAASAQKTQAALQQHLQHQQQQHYPQQQQQPQPGSLTLSSMYGANSSTTPYGMNLGSYSHHAMPASPLAHMRSSSNNGHMTNGSNVGKGRHGVNLNAGGVESPLRGNDGSPSRMIVNNSPPVSNVRDDSGPGERRGASKKARSSGDRRNAATHLSAKSPARLLQHSPVRGSPLRPGGAAGSDQQSSSMLLSPAGMHLQMAMGHQQAQNGGNAPSTVLTYGAGSSTPLMQRWGLASNSPARRMGMDTSIFSPGQPFLTPNAHGNVSGGGLDDPFDYSGHLQHELDMASELSLNGLPHGDPSPMKGFENHAFGSRSGVAHSLHYMGHAGAGNYGNNAAVFGNQQQQQQQQQQLQHDNSHGNMASYNPFMQSHS